MYESCPRRLGQGEIAQESYVLQPAAARPDRFRPSGHQALPTEIMDRIIRFLRGPPQCSSDVRPCSVMETRCERREPTVLRVECPGREPHPSCRVSLLEGHLAWELWPQPMYNPLRAEMPVVDDGGAVLLHHCTDVARGLRIVRTGCMEYGRQQHRPNGAYTARGPAPFYDLGCHVVLRVPGVVVSKAGSGRFPHAGVYVRIRARAVLGRGLG